MTSLEAKQKPPADQKRWRVFLLFVENRGTAASTALIIYQLSSVLLSRQLAKEVEGAGTIRVLIFLWLDTK
jgi:hypothetical protein